MYHIYNLCLRFVSFHVVINFLDRSQKHFGDTISVGASKGLSWSFAGLDLRWGVGGASLDLLKPLASESADGDRDVQVYLTLSQP